MTAISSLFGAVGAEFERQRMIETAQQEAERDGRAADRDEKFMRRPPIDVDYERVPGGEKQG